MSHRPTHSFLCSAHSNLTNKSRLKLLHRREEHLQELFEEARTAVEGLAKDSGRYVQFLEGVIVQGFLQMLEPEVKVLARKRDAQVVTQAAENASKQYRDISGREVNFTVEGTLNDDG